MKAVTEFGSAKETLRHSELFQGLSDDELDKLLPLSQEEIYEAGMVIACAGEPCRYVQTIEHGKVALEIELAIGHNLAESATIDVIADGSNFCCSALIEPSILTDTVRSLERTKVILLDIEGLKASFDENPQMGYKVTKNLAKVVSSRLESMKQTVGRMLAVIFHDLKTPLAAVEGYNRLLLGEFAGELNEEQRKMIHRSSKRLSELLNLVSNMIDFSRIDLGDLRMERISPTKAVEDCFEAMHHLAKEKGLRLVTELPLELSDVLGVPGRFQQVLTNLLSNAIKFTPSGGVVIIKAKDETDTVRVEVADTGIGIPAEELPKIFDGFYRGLNIAERGAGLGLSITKKIVEAHHGRIWVESPCPENGKGSKFTFILPKIEERLEEKIK